MNQGVARMLGSLLAYNDDMDIYEYTVPHQSPLEGMAFDEALTFCRDRDLLLIAVQEPKSDTNPKPNLLINPARSNECKLCEGYRMIILARFGKELRKLRK